MSVATSTSGPVSAADLFAAPNAIASDYSQFRVADRLLLSGHSHQAWPDRGFDGQKQAWLDAAELVDRKWERAFERAERVRDGWRRLLGDPSGAVTLGANTHDLLVRLLSALPLRQRPRIVTTDGEFHTMRRQFDRLAEEGLEIVRVEAAPAATLAERLADAVDDRDGPDGRVQRHVPDRPSHSESPHRRRGVRTVRQPDGRRHLPRPECRAVRSARRRAGKRFCHRRRLQVQLGEGNCFLRLPAECTLRPVITGWFAEFEALTKPTSRAWPTPPAARRFAGATYDPTAHYRAAEVFAYFEGARPRRHAPPRGEPTPGGPALEWVR